MLKTSYYIICFGDAAAYRVYVYMLHPLQGGRSTGYSRRPTSVTDSPLSTGILYGRLQRVTIPEAVIIQFVLKMSKELIETC